MSASRNRPKHITAFQGSAAALRIAKNQLATVFSDAVPHLSRSITRPESSVGELGNV
jgi:hypothetical protein